MKLSLTLFGENIFDNYPLKILLFMPDFQVILDTSLNYSIKLLLS